MAKLREDLGLEDYWRAIILRGRNVATYKFALAQSLLEFANANINDITLEQLAKPYSAHIVRHLKTERSQITRKNNPGKFLDACKKSLTGKMSETQLLEITEQEGFNQVIDAFHNVNREEVPERFYVRTANKGIQLTDNVFKLNELYQAKNLPGEIESRWNLVETAWTLNLPTRILTVEYDPDGHQLFTTKDGSANKRIDITGTKDALNGYQQGKCFYCYQNISIETNSSDICHVDHYFPKTLNRDEEVIPGIDTIWNLVLACKNCNGASEKWQKILVETHVEELHERNEYLIASSLPLRNVIEALTGKNATKRISFLKEVWKKAERVLVNKWEPKPVGPKPIRQPINKQ